MKARYSAIRPTFLACLSLVCAGNLYSQNPGTRRPGNQQNPSQPPGVAQILNVGDTVQIQAADGSWIQGTIRSIDPATGKYEVVLVNGMSGLAAGTALRKVASAAPQTGAQPAPQVVSQSGVAAAQPAAAAAICGAQPACTEVRDFAASISNFRLSNERGYQIQDVTIRFTNKTAQPLAIGYVDGSAGIVDDRGNRFPLRGDQFIRGMGILRGNTPDAKFVVQAGDSGIAQFQFYGVPAQNIVGSAYQLDLTVRELTPVGTGQYTLGAEFPLEFPGIGQTTLTAAPAAGVPGGVASAAPGQPGAAMPQAAAAAQQPVAGQPTAKSRFASMIGLSQAAGGTQAASAVPQLAAFTPQTGQAAAPVQNAASMIPGFSSAPGQAVGGVVSQAAAMIPGFSPSPASAAPVAPVAGGVAPTAGGNLCAGQQHCFNAGDFAAEVVQLTGASGANNDYTVRAHVIFRNMTAQPITLGYVAGTGAVSDNAGNRFAPTMTGTTDQTIPVNTRIALAAGGTGQATFVLTRRGPTAPAAVGTAFNLVVTVDELLAAAGGQVHTGAVHSINLAGLTCSCAAVAKPSTTPASALRNALGTKK